MYDKNSFTSTYPLKEQIYIEEVWNLDEDGFFVNRIEDSRGIIIIGDDISSIEFLKK